MNRGNEVGSIEKEIRNREREIRNVTGNKEKEIGEMK